MYMACTVCTAIYNTLGNQKLPGRGAVTVLSMDGLGVESSKQGYFPR